jgi:hypothetical protein
MFSFAANNKFALWLNTEYLLVLRTFLFSGQTLPTGRVSRAISEIPGCYPRETLQQRLEMSPSLRRSFQHRWKPLHGIFYLESHSEQITSINF